VIDLLSFLGIGLIFYLPVVVDEASKEGAVVDPYDWKKMLEVIKEKGVNVSHAFFLRNRIDPFPA
jgi:hypothetical protein